MTDNELGLIDVAVEEVKTWLTNAKDRKELLERVNALHNALHNLIYPRPKLFLRKLKAEFEGLPELWVFVENQRAHQYWIASPVEQFTDFLGQASSWTSKEKARLAAQKRGYEVVEEVSTKKLKKLILQGKPGSWYFVAENKYEFWDSVGSNHEDSEFPEFTQDFDYRSEWSSKDEAISAAQERGYEVVEEAGVMKEQLAMSENFYG